MTLRLLALFLAALLSAGASPAATDISTDDAKRLARSSNAFGIDAYRRLAKRPGNLVFSPASVSTGLAMPWGGARGDTAAEMKRVLRFDAEPAPIMTASGKLAASLRDAAQPSVIRIANRLFGEQTFRFDPAFIEATRRAYGASLEPVSFRRGPEEARAIINRWVEAQTEQRIRDLLPPEAVDDTTSLVLVNAIYFLGEWEQRFAKVTTRPAPFHVSKTDRKDVPMMHHSAIFRFARLEGYGALELRYQGGTLSMLPVLPDAVDGLAAFEQSLTEERLEAIVQALRQPVVKVDVALPSFQLSPVASLSLRGILAAMGMPAAFDPSRADFTGIASPVSAQQRVVIRDVFHKAFVRVDEKGTEAAAATGGVSRFVSAEPPAGPTFNVDHPFLFLIRHNASGLVLFIGRVADPSAN